jgi:hypothetical protein
VMLARQCAQPDRGFCVAGKGGNNDESHNHNDVGSFLLYREGSPVIVDAGAESYTAKTFSPQRYEIWTMQSAYHNLPTVGGVMQSAGEQYRAESVRCETGENIAAFTAELRGAYPAEAGISTYVRSVKLDRTADTVTVADTMKLDSPETVEYMFLCACRPEISADGIRLFSRSGTEIAMEYDRKAFEAAAETIEITDGKLRGEWGDRLFRLHLRSRAPSENGSSTVVFRADPPAPSGERQ